MHRELIRLAGRPGHILPVEATVQYPFTRFSAETVAAPAEGVLAF